MTRLCFTLDLRNDPQRIEEYKRHHRDVWPEVRESIAAADILDMELYLFGTHLFMIMEVGDRFSFAAKEQIDRSNPRVQAWEHLMGTYQQAVRGAPPGEKWVLMERIFSLVSP